MRERKAGINEPIEWLIMREAILAGKVNGIPEINLPETFLVNDTLLETFQEMLPATDSETDSKIRELAYQGGDIGPEDARVLVTDRSETKLFVQQQNHGISIRTETGITTAIAIPPGAIGLIHTHPIDEMPSHFDILMLLTREHVLAILVTPLRIIMLFRTPKTLFLGDDILGAEMSLLNIVGTMFGRNTLSPGSSYSRLGLCWVADYPAMVRLLGLACYEAARGEKIFRRITIE